MSAFKENEREARSKQALYERDISADSHNERNMCAVQTRYKWDELGLIANITQYHYECVS